MIVVWMTLCFIMAMNIYQKDRGFHE